MAESPIADLLGTTEEALTGGQPLSDDPRFGLQPKKVQDPVMLEKIRNDGPYRAVWVEEVTPVGINGCWFVLTPNPDNPEPIMVPGPVADVVANKIAMNKAANVKIRALTQTLLQPERAPLYVR